MNAKRLIEHARDVLLAYELKQMGVSADSMKHDVFKIGDRWKRDLREPIIFDEEQFLKQYFQEQEISDEVYRTFISETFLGCIRHQKLIDGTLKLFHDKTGGRYLHNEYYIFAVLTYLILWRLEEITFEKLSKFIRSFDPVKMSRFVGFMFNPVNIESQLKEEWGKILDHEYLKEKAIDPIMRHVPAAQKLLEDLCDCVEFGMVAKKSEKKPTEPEPFLLTKPRPRKLPEPTETINVSIKARPVPKTLYEVSSTEKNLQKKRVENREKVKELMVSAQKNQFSVALRKPSNKIEKLREALEQEERQKMERERLKLAKPIPNFEAPSIKLTTAAILREDALIRKKRMDEEQYAQKVEMSLRDASCLEAKNEELKAREEEARLLEIERRRLEIQVLHEDVYEAKQQKIKEKRAQVADMLAEKEEMKTIGEMLKKEQEEINQKKIESVHEIKEGIVKAKQKIVSDNVKNVLEVQKQNQALLELAQKEAEKELKRKAELIQQIRSIERSIPAVGTIVKDVDITETSGLGLLSEMSILELQERLRLAKRREQEEEERKREEIIELKKKRLNQIQDKLKEIDRERENRRNSRVSKALPERGLSTLSTRSDRSDMSIKSVIIENNPALRALQATLEAKKAARLNAKAEMDKKQRALLTGKSYSRSASSFKSHSTTRPDTAASQRWDELDEAEKEFMHQRRQLQREHDLLLAEVASDEMKSSMDVPIVELKAI